MEGIKKSRYHSFVVNLPEKKYLSDEGQPVEFDYARIFRNRELAYDLADIFNGKVEIVDITCQGMGLIIREVEADTE